MNKDSAVRKLNALLELSRRVVGVKTANEREFGLFEARELVKPMGYCVAVKCAMEGHSIKIDRSTSGCPGGGRALGLAPPPEDYLNGGHGVRMGLFRNAEVAAGVARSIPIGAPGTYGVIVKPLLLFEADPDAVLIVADSRTIMRVLQGYTYSYGLPHGMHMSGNQAVCVECTVTPMRTGSVNVSMMCSGTRHNAKWKDHESMIGIPFDRFFGTVAGIEATVNAVEPDERKRRIEEALKEANLLETEVEYGKMYYVRKK